MAKFITTFFIVFALSGTAFSQTSNTAVFAVHAGYNSASVIADQNLTNSTRRSGFNAGLSADYFFSESWSIKGRLAYSQKGWNKSIYIINNVPVTSNYHIDYLTIPVTANLHFGSTKNWYLGFGPYVGILLSASETTGGTNLKENFNSTDFGGELGLGIKFPVLERSYLFVELNGQVGINDVFKNNPVGSTRNSVASINAGFEF